MRNSKLYLFFTCLSLLVLACGDSPVEPDQPTAELDTRSFEDLSVYSIPAEIHLPDSDMHINLSHHTQAGSGQQVLQLNENLAVWMRMENTSLNEFKSELEVNEIFTLEYLRAQENTLFCKAKLPDGSTVAHHIISQVDLGGSNWIARTDPSAQLSGIEADFLLEAIQSIRHKK